IFLLVGPPRYWTGGRLPPWRTRDWIQSRTSDSNQPIAIGLNWTRRGNAPPRSRRQIWTPEYPVNRSTSGFRIIRGARASPARNARREVEVVPPMSFRFIGIHFDSQNCIEEIRWRRRGRILPLYRWFKMATKTLWVFGALTVVSLWTIRGYVF